MLPYSKLSCLGRSRGLLKSPLQKQTSLRFFMRNKDINSSGKSKRLEIAPRVEPHGGMSDVSFKKLLKPLAFTVVFSAGSFAGCAIWQYENMLTRAQQFAQRSQDMYTDRFPRYKFSSLRQRVNRVWNSLSEGQKVTTAIIGINALVFLAWKIPRFQPAMAKWFCSNPASKAMCLPMVLSSFSHFSVWHLAANMYVLWTFSTTIVNILGKEQFLAMYLSAGVISSLASYLHKTAIVRPGLSLGASGAIMSVLGSVCTQIPQAQLAILFLPWFSFTASSGIKAVLALDTAGVMLGWRVFDHAAHLGGCLFGIWYVKYGSDLIWKRREPLMSQWHAFRQRPRS
ncbi:PREDICTED: presenilins-associated rhomboid-like protein, mitochondrial [Priapulus caudatus]|uniref:rhomboid protease n=1 Tax=Priapulus caudatus TaxID=37621 RepID=A0ABM1FB21_PRICU|nr:PREDICTED: presenilins-associated rhomboid-like protein, mitochondrial [Priapulus caudatus]XP_014681643.1 PREDICTED: presenilins-associated rhomboid-like protein, mitochondrial [Priapulus caudatus]